METEITPRQAWNLTDAEWTRISRENPELGKRIARLRVRRMMPWFAVAGSLFSSFYPLNGYIGCILLGALAVILFIRNWLTADGRSVAAHNRRWGTFYLCMVPLLAVLLPVFFFCAPLAFCTIMVAINLPVWPTIKKTNGR